MDRFDGPMVKREDGEYVRFADVKEILVKAGLWDAMCETDENGWQRRCDAFREQMHLKHLEHLVELAKKVIANIPKEAVRTEAFPALVSFRDLTGVKTI